MKTIEVKTNGNKIIVNLPTKLKEITPEWLDDVSNNIKVAPNYALIGIIFKDNLGLLINSTKRKNDQSRSAIPVLVKTGSNDEFLDGISCGTPIIIAGSSVAMGNHIVCSNNTISGPYVLGLISSDDNCRREHMIDNETIYLVEFKLVPFCDIHGAIEEVEKIDNPFLTIIKDSEEVVLS